MGRLWHATQFELKVHILMEFRLIYMTEVGTWHRFSLAISTMSSLLAWDCISCVRVMDL